MTEEFRDIKGYEGLYQVSNLGNIKSFKYKQPRILKPKNHLGYKAVSLLKDAKLKTVLVHQLVAIAFMNHTPNRYKIVIDHINDDKSDNRLENLQIITPRENAYKTQLRRNEFHRYENKYTSEYKGVTIQKVKYKDKEYTYIKAQIRINEKKIYLGSFTTEKKASEAYQNALKTLVNSVN